MKDLFCIILAGGIGSRFYPLSHEDEPKQFLLFGRFFDHSSGSSNSNGMRLRYVGDYYYYYYIKAHAESHYSPLSWCRERATAMSCQNRYF